MQADCSFAKVSSKEAGFALLEVLVALAILALTLSVLVGVLSDGVGRARQAEALAEAGLRARSLLARVGTEIPLRQGLTTGQFANGLRWQLRIEVYGDATERRAWPVGAYSVSAEIVWHDGVRERSAVLTTLRLGPKEPIR